jgi:putative phosphoesterase
MTLLILSDSHGRADRVAEAIRRVRPDGILFAGDGLRDLTYCDLPCPLWAVRGNCDWIRSPLILGGSAIPADDLQDEELITLDGVRILLTHGHKYGVKGGLGSAVAAASRQDADILIFGHTHIPLELHLSPDGAYEYGVAKPLTVFNPGSLGDSDASFGTLTIRGGQILLGHGNL